MTSGNEPPLRCTSGPDNSCQFNMGAQEYHGRSYCKFHAPLDAPFKCQFAQLQAFVGTQSRPIDMSGTVFPAATGNEEYRFNRDTIAQGCTFAAGVRLYVQDRLDISNSNFLGDANVVWVNSAIIARHVQFGGNATIICVDANLVDLSDSKVSGHLRFERLRPAVEFHLDDAALAYAPDIVVDGTPQSMPQNSSLRRLRLSKETAFGPGAEGRYRTIRNLFHASRDREQEGTFYRYEKRALRKGLPLRQPASWVPRAVSACYDWLAGYGQSYERALLWFIGLQIGFGLLYSVMSGRFAWGGAIDSQVAAFVVAQVVKPFELLSTRTPTGWPYVGVYSGGSGWWTLGTMAHSVLSLTLVALFLLALRWRFRRD
jgi:hypothetical protein